ncbi:NUDIX hydrolase N-terminal domain-containing protein [Streptococcus cameli]
MHKEDKWLEWAVRLQSLAQNGLAYTTNAFDKERFEEIRQIAAEMLVTPSDLPLEKVEELFCNETGYQTPKLDTRAAIFKDEKILLVQEADGRWALPGGWCDVDQSILENTIKEAKEEAGLNVRAERLIAVLDKHKHHPNTKRFAHHVTKAFVLCTSLGGEFVPNNETIASGYFSLDQLPVLSEQKTTAKQLEMCFEASKADYWETRFD